MTRQQTAVSVRNTGQGIRHTAQRRVLLDIIRESGSHLGADELYLKARERQHSISLSTVYRNLKTFKEQGLVKEHHFDDGCRRYESKPRKGHHHLVCVDCGRIIEFECPSTECLKTKIAQEQGFQVTEVEVYLAGRCPECQRRFLKAAAAARRGEHSWRGGD